MSPDARAFLGVDLGTSGLKLSLVGADGVVLAEAEASYEVRAPAPGHAEIPAGQPSTMVQHIRNLLRPLV